MDLFAFIATGAGVAAALAGFLSSAIVDVKARIASNEKLDSAEEQFRQHPEKPQLAWDLARIKLESYLDRNLSQVRWIFWWTLVVMMVGFGFVLYGLIEATENPVKLTVSLVGATSGVLISFIGGSFLVIYRSILAQSKDYVTVLERINAVGMAVQVIASIPDRSAEQKDATSADLARQLLSMYAVTSPPLGTRRPSRNVDHEARPE